MSAYIWYTLGQLIWLKRAYFGNYTDIKIKEKKIDNLHNKLLFYGFPHNFVHEFGIFIPFSAKWSNINPSSMISIHSAKTLHFHSEF